MLLVLVTISLVAAGRTLAIQREMADEDARKEARTLRAMMSYWEENIFRQAASWLDELGTTPDIGAAERRLRDNVPWFDAFYIWTPGPGSPRMHYPGRSLVEDQSRLMRHPCLAHADRLARYASRSVAAAAFRACKDTPPSTSLLASSQAAALYQQEGRYAEAWACLNEVSVPLMLPLHEAVSQGLSPARLVIRRIQGAQLQGALGQPARQQELLLSTAREIADLDAPQLEELLSFIEYTIPWELKRAGLAHPTDALSLRMERADRRIAAYEEITQRLLTRAVPRTGEPLQIASDPYGDNRFLLIYGPIAEGRMMAAIQLDPDTMLAEMPRSPLQPERVILDAEGRPLSGTETIQPQDIWVEVPFGRLFPHLRAGLLHRQESRRHEALWLLSQLVFIALMLAFGIAAIVARMLADRRQEELYARQADFIARVTHELKTPLAGIRLMAETLEMGAAEDAEQREIFVGRILREADRLGDRIDEVLRVARKPSAPSREPLDPVELLESLAEQWRPRLEEVGGELSLHTSPLPELEADTALLTDALNNLLSNALKYRREDRPLRCEIHLRKEGHFAVFEVVDNGLGVPPALRRTIFERFARVERPGRGKAGGHGLGLSFVAETAQAHEGSAECRDGIDGGSRFILKIRYPRGVDSRR